MDREHAVETEFLFTVAEATWRHEANKVLGRNASGVELTRLPEARGEPGTLLRTAYEARERAFAAWCRARRLD